MQEANRTHAPQVTGAFFDNLRTVLDRYGTSKVSALPTIPPRHFSQITEIIDAYAGLGFHNIYLRPVSYHGFARKQFADVRLEIAPWLDTYKRALRHIFDRNTQTDAPFTEFNLQLALKRIFTPGHNNHVDFRSPNPAGHDYVVVNHDGAIYASDEARMLARIGESGFAIGDLARGLDQDAADALTWNQIAEVHEDCIHCAFQPYCGSDIIDDLARSGRIDQPKQDTWFCQWHLFLFRTIFQMIADADPIDIMNLNGHLTGRFTVDPFFGACVHDPA
jgi:radical SAM protein with 4Fe4S-binding SPASM domain